MKTKEEKRQQAVARQRERDARSAEKQLALLNRRLGPGVGAKRERERLHAIINSADEKGDSE